jgi:uncharacterized protein YgiM (DUF1202 family)
MNYQQSAIAALKLLSLPLCLAIAIPGLLAASPSSKPISSSPNLSLSSSNLHLAQTPDRPTRCTSGFRTVKTQDGSSLNLRDRPGTQSRITTTIPNNSEVFFNVSDRSGEWSEVTIRGGKTGWVASRFLARPESIAVTYPTRMRVKTLDGGALNIRNSPSLGGTVVGTVASGTTVTAHKFVGYWTEITTLSGTRGYVVTGYLLCK